MAIDIQKRVEKVGIVLAKKQMKNIQAQVKLAIDRSGSMDGLYRNGTVQDVVERMLAIGMTFDMDKSLDVWAFHNESFPVKTVKLPIMENYVRKEIEQKISSGGTSYAPVLNDIIEDSKGSAGSKGFLGFGKREAKAGDPTLVIFITDGENDDPHEAETTIRKAQSENIYFLLVGIGRANFRFIESMGDKYPNVGFIAIDDISTVDDEALYEALLNDELATWFQKFSK